MCDMTKCEIKKKCKLPNGTTGEDWFKNDVKIVAKGDNYRCSYCHGEVILHKQQKEDGPQDHVTHKSKDDSENCKGGVYFKGTHRMSKFPVE